MYYILKKEGICLFKGVRKILKLWSYCFYLSIKSQLQYKTAFIIRCIVMFFTYFCEFVATWFLISQFNSIESWTTDEIILTYGLATLAYALSRFIFHGFYSVSRQIRDGKFYLNMIRPLNEKLYLMIQGVPMERLGQVILGLFLVVYVYIKFHETISLLKLILYVINGTILYGALFILSAAISFWIVESRELTGIMTHGTLRAIVYPLFIYDKILVNIMTYLIPVAFISYYPSMVLLGKTQNFFISFFIFLAGGVTLIFSLFLWHLGLKRYEGSGG